MFVLGLYTNKKTHKQHKANQLLKLLTLTDLNTLFYSCTRTKENIVSTG